MQGVQSVSEEERAWRVDEERAARAVEPAGRCPDCGHALWQRVLPAGCGGEETGGGIFRVGAVIYHPPVMSGTLTRHFREGRWVPGQPIAPTAAQVAAAETEPADLARRLAGTLHDAERLLGSGVVLPLDLAPQCARTIRDARLLLDSLAAQGIIDAAELPR